LISDSGLLIAITHPVSLDIVEESTPLKRGIN